MVTYRQGQAAHALSTPLLLAQNRLQAEAQDRLLAVHLAHQVAVQDHLQGVEAQDPAVQESNS